jgi:hypothetical protein
LPRPRHLAATLAATSLAGGCGGAGHPPGAGSPPAPAGPSARLSTASTAPTKPAPDDRITAAKRWIQAADHAYSTGHTEAFTASSLLPSYHAPDAGHRIPGHGQLRAGSADGREWARSPFGDCPKRNQLAPVGLSTTYTNRSASCRFRTK